jgi:hypothetical protein
MLDLGLKIRDARIARFQSLTIRLEHPKRREQVTAASRP